MQLLARPIMRNPPCSPFLHRYSVQLACAGASSCVDVRTLEILQRSVPTTLVSPSLNSSMIIVSTMKGVSELELKTIDNSSDVCPLDTSQLQAVEKDCGDPSTCKCVVETIQSEANPRICAEYVAADSLFRNSIVSCIRRDCDEFQYLLVFLLLLGGGIFGGTYLFCANSCSFRPKDDDEMTERDALEKEEEDVVEDLESENEDDEKQPVDVDLCDGIDDGEIGVLAQLALPYLVKSALDGEESEEEARRGKARIAVLAACASLAKKLGLKLVLVVPLVLQHNWVPVGFFAIDILVLIYFGFTGAYCPGSLYNELHVIIVGRRFVKTYRWRRFSLWMKFLVGFQGYSTVLGTAAQLATLVCLSLRLYIGRALLARAEVQDLATAAAGLLNVKGVIISCFAGLLFVEVVIFFICSR